MAAINQHQVRQGDVMFEKVSRLPKGAKKQPVSGKTYIVKRGEASGHAHVLEMSDIELWLDEDGQRFLKVINDTLAQHVLEGSGTLTGEHDTVPLAAGIYRLPEQVEFDDDDMRAVAD